MTDDRLVSIFVAELLYHALCFGVDQKFDHVAAKLVEDLKLFDLDKLFIVTKLHFSDRHSYLLDKSVQATGSLSVEADKSCRSQLSQALHS